jgi:hypothetical protein
MIPAEPYPELHPVLQAFADGMEAALGTELAGLYLVGSLATGNFDLDSDVDFLAVVQRDLSGAEQTALQALHAAVHAQDSYPAKHLEGSYIPLTDLQDAASVGEKPVFYFDNGSVVPEWSTHDNQWHVRWVLRERGIRLFGPEPAQLLPAVPRAAMLDEIRAALQRATRGFREQVDAPLCFHNSRFGQSFFVLTACRMLHSLATGTVQSKKAGAEWAKQTVDPAWVPLIDQAWQEREGVRFMVKIGQCADPELLRRTLAFMEYAAGLASDPAPYPPGSGPAAAGWRMSSCPGPQRE